MSSRTPDWEDLNAYVDGELGPARAAEVAERIARDSAFARQAASLTGMKAVLAEQDSVPDFNFDAPAADRKRARRWQAIAASIVVIFAVSAFWAAQFTASEPAWLAAAAAAHDSLAARTSSASPQAAQVAARTGFHPYIPDLAAAKLSLAATAPLTVNDAPDGIAMQYLGTRGCKVTYIAFPGAGAELGEELAAVESGELTGYGWRVGAIGYALLAQGMDPNRLAVIAENVHAASRLHRPLDDDARTQLAQSRAESRACVA